MSASSLVPALPVTDDAERGANAAPALAEVHWDAETGALRLPNGRVIDLRHRVPLRRIVSALVRLHRASPGTPATARDLVAAGWPGERLLPCAATNRLYVALATLRTLGLRGCLRRGRGGWHIDTDLRVVTDEPRVHLLVPSDPVCAW
ncbi:MAG TPA: hypothetical protein VFG69_14670 [Nannocystaceae bacterium]|nr:hypothetical protein [Nannocystaceae bacterium]